MTYRPSISPRLSGGPDLPPRVICDGCGLTRTGLTKRGDLTMWLMRRKAPPGWLLVRREEIDGSVYRRDFCPACRLDPAARAPADPGKR